ncbi:type VI secretion system membrane subunit TssM [Paraburkholderia rhizosphaerae]|uniref:Type VI secretion system protein ImpL n=1 Tax=Paraburkholderia rhizosphaerae TaxID=480658 RepID=A0A4R8LX37_9BURK|nr:type VI secretion system membrane subunit TssM [Paraburkholderia rhizosphaerae]TDY52750.1 type VI secretion system protein ImpL [Paraburkholderia rhizosphaerae]
MSQLKTWVKSRWFMTAVGLLLIAVLIWLGGPYLGIGDSQPLASATARLALILAIVLIWLICVQIVQWRQRRKTARMSDELASQDAQLAAGERGATERAQLQQRFQEAIDTLRKTRKNGGNLYALPWYVVIGPPGSGKSTLLQNSGLDFPLSERFGKEALRGIGGTRDCDWWFTDEAVFLDTAGRYTTQDSDAVADASAWSEFLKLLRRYRRRRPLNGVIVTLSMSDLLTFDDGARQQHIRIVRRRLDELAQHLKVRVPVYLVFTKCDLVAGFGEFFDDLGPEQRSQVWGMTFPAGKTIDGSAYAMFAAEFDLLLERLNTRLIERLHAERDRTRRAAVLSFPQQLGAVREIARQFVEGVFARHEYGQPPLLRGAYLTSGTQEGTPIDRMLGAVARTFGVDAARVRNTGVQQRTYFVERLLKEVLFRESGFAGTNPQLERQKIILQTASYAGIALVTALLVAALATSYARNRGYVAQVQDALKDFPARDSLADSPDLKTYFARALERVEVIAGAQDVADQYHGHVPWLMRFGLFQGHALLRQVHGAYLRELNGSLLPGAGVRFREGLSASASDPQALYGYLKGYLMLGEPQHLDPAELAALARIEWQRLFPQDPAIQRALDKHFTALLNDPQKPRALTLDNALVDQARATLKTADLSTLIYGGLKLDADRSGAPGIRLDQSLGLLANVFTRKSGAPLSQPLPALFTRPYFASEVDKGLDESVDRFVKDDWVFGATRIDPLARSRFEQQVLTLYEQDYIKTWDGLLADLQLQPVANIQDASALSAKLSGPSSPLKALLNLVRDNTSDLLRGTASGANGASGASNVDAAAAQAKARSKTVGENLALRRALNTHIARELNNSGAGLPTSVRPNAAAGVNDPQTEQPGAAIEAHFAQINELSAGTPGSTPLDHTLGVLDQLSKTLLTMNDFSDPGALNSPALLSARQETGQLPPQVGTLVASLTGSSAQLVASGTSGALADQFRAAAGNDCASFVDGRYPFAPGSTSDIPVQNFADLFGNGGRFDSFFKGTLAKLVDTSGRSWRWKAGAPAGPPSVLETAQSADDLRQIYFRGGAAPQVGFTLLAPQLDPAIAKLTVEIDGQKYEYAAGGPPSAAMTWPGPQPGRVTVSAFDTAGQPVGAPLQYQGDWAFFHALDAAHLQKQGDLRYLASFDFAGHVAQLPIQPASLKNPFLNAEVRRFRCPR